MYLRQPIGQWKTVAKGTFLLVGPGWCELSRLLNRHTYLDLGERELLIQGLKQQWGTLVDGQHVP